MAEHMIVGLHKLKSLFVFWKHRISRWPQFSPALTTVCDLHVGRGLRYAGIGRSAARAAGTIGATVADVTRRRIGKIAERVIMSFMAVLACLKMPDVPAGCGFSAMTMIE